MGIVFGVNRLLMYPFEWAELSSLPSGHGFLLSGQDHVPLYTLSMHQCILGNISAKVPEYKAGNPL